tara:strand:- start:767 stop:1195 length:429 start_codon:yes stop_codon:yes gene_type:complete
MLLCFILFSCKDTSTDTIEEVDGFPEAFQHVWQDSYYTQEGISGGNYFTETSFFGWNMGYDDSVQIRNCYETNLGGVYVSHEGDEYILDLLGTIDDGNTRDILIINATDNELIISATYDGNTIDTPYQKTLFSVDDLTPICD